MAYSEITKSEAFMLYCQGISFRQIADILKTHPGCGSITHSTIKKWSEIPDIKGQTWEDRKSEYLAVVQQTEKGTVVKQHKDIITRTNDIKDNLLKDIEAGSLTFKTKDAAIYSFLAIQKYQDKVTDQKKRITIEEQVTLFIEAMNEIPAVSEVLSNHWDEINKRFQDKARALQSKKKHGRD